MSEIPQYVPKSKRSLGNKVAGIFAARTQSTETEPKVNIPLAFLKKVQYMEKYPDQLKKYIRKCFQQCVNDEGREIVSNKLVELINSVSVQGMLTQYEWHVEPVVTPVNEPPKQEPPPSPKQNKKQKFNSGNKSENKQNHKQQLAASAQPDDYSNKLAYQYPAGQNTFNTPPQYPPVNQQGQFPPNYQYNQYQQQYPMPEMNQAFQQTNQPNQYYMPPPNQQPQYSQNDSFYQNPQSPTVQGQNSPYPPYQQNPVNNQYQQGPNQYQNTYNEQVNPMNQQYQQNNQNFNQQSNQNFQQPNQQFNQQPQFQQRQQFDQNYASYSPQQLAQFNSQNQQQNNFQFNIQSPQNHQKPKYTTNLKSPKAAPVNEYSTKTKKNKKLKLLPQPETNEPSLDELVKEFRIVGTSQDLEKEYFRIIGEPDPKTVRPLPILIKSLDHCLEKYNQSHDYEYICEQLRCIRQDLTMQHIEDKFAVKVYETHIRLAIEQSDWENYNQIQTSLELLYKQNLGDFPNICENAGYRILYLVGVNDISGLYSYIPRIDSNVLKSNEVQFAMSVWRTTISGEWIKYFDLMKNATSLCNRVMAISVGTMRENAIVSIVKSIRKGITLKNYQELLCFDTIEETREFLVDSNVTIPEE